MVKGGYVIVADNEKITIDNNETIAKKLEALSLKKIEEHQQEETSEEGFVEGIDPFQVAQLTADNVESEEQIHQEILQQEEEILRNANEEAENVMQEAMAQANAMKESAYNEGYESGHTEGMAAAQSEIQQMEDELKRHYAQEEARLHREFQQMEDNLESDLVQVLTDVYSHVLGIELKEHNDLILMILKKAMQELDSSNNYIIHVSREDFMMVKQAKEEISKACGIPEDKLEIIEDNTVGQSGCMIESDCGIFDCGLDTQLKLLKKQLCLISYQKSEE